MPYEIKIIYRGYTKIGYSNTPELINYSSSLGDTLDYHIPHNWGYIIIGYSE